MNHFFAQAECLAQGGHAGAGSVHESMARDLRTVRRADEEAVRANARRHLAQQMGMLRGLEYAIGPW